jgi:hypothetical protein
MWLAWDKVPPPMATYWIIFQQDGVHVRTTRVIGNTRYSSDIMVHLKGTAFQKDGVRPQITNKILGVLKEEF